MKGSRSLKQIALAGVLAVSSVVFGGGSGANAQPIPVMTIQVLLIIRLISTFTR